MNENDIVERKFFCVGTMAFEHREEAINYVRKQRANILITNNLEMSDIYFKDTCAGEIADWIIENFAAIAAAVQGD